jgi:hypothetical protein
MHCHLPGGVLLDFVERCLLFSKGEVKLHFQHTACEPSRLCISDRVIDGVDPKWGVIVVCIEILFVDLLFMPLAPRAPP